MAKVTKRDNFVAILAVEGLTAEQVEFVEAQIALLDKRKGSARGMTQTQKDNVILKGDIVEVLAEAGIAVTATDVAKALDVNVQKASQLLKQLVEAGEVTKTEAKGKTKATFAVA